MIVLDATTRKLEIVLAGAITTNQLEFVASYHDSTLAPPATNHGVSNNTTAVTLVAAPASGVQRTLDFLSIYNADTVSATVTVRLNDNATLRTIENVALPAGSSLIFVRDAGGTIVLDTILRKLEVVLAGAITTNQLPFVASYQDSTLAPPATNDGASNSTTAVTLVAAPASGVQRRLNFLSVYNADTVSATAAVQLNDNGTLRRIVNVALSSGAMFNSIFSAGWSVFPAASSGGGGGGTNWIVSDVSKSANFSPVTGDKGKLFQVTTGASTITATLPAAATAGDGWYIFLRKVDSGSGVLATSPAETPANTLSQAEIGDLAVVWTDGTTYFAAIIPASIDTGSLVAPLISADIPFL